MDSKLSFKLARESFFEILDLDLQRDKSVIALDGCAVGAVGWEVAGMLDGGCALDFFESALARASIQSRASGESSWWSISHWI